MTLGGEKYVKDGVVATIRLWKPTLYHFVLHLRWNPECCPKETAPAMIPEDQEDIHWPREDEEKKLLRPKSLLGPHYISPPVPKPKPPPEEKK